GLDRGGRLGRVRRLVGAGGAGQDEGQGQRGEGGRERQRTAYGPHRGPPRLAEGRCERRADRFMVAAGGSNATPVFVFPPRRFLVSMRVARVLLAFLVPEDRSCRARSPLSSCSWPPPPMPSRRPG